LVVVEFPNETHPVAARTLYRINLTSVERTELERLERGHTTAQDIAKRARIILMANEEGLSNQDIATRLGATLIPRSKIMILQGHGARCAYDAGDKMNYLVIMMGKPPALPGRQ
jgi:DNA-binding CsgD family transcriptional regulator